MNDNQMNEDIEPSCDAPRGLDRDALYALVPGSMTMGEFDKLTCEVFYKIRAAWEKAIATDGNGK